MSLTESGAANEVFAAGQASGRVFRVNLDSGDREEFAADCNLGVSSNLDQIRYNAAANELLILGDNLYSFDLAAEQCATLPLNTSILEVQPASAEQLLGVTFGTLLQYDRDTGEVVVVSK